jgi:Flp pilus assembly protein TadD
MREQSLIACATKTLAEAKESEEAGEFDEARRLCKEAASKYEEAGFKDIAGYILHKPGELSLGEGVKLLEEGIEAKRQGDFGRAIEKYGEAARKFNEARNEYIAGGHDKYAELMEEKFKQLDRDRTETEKAIEAISRR